MTTEEKILERVRKMLAIANDSAATEAERDLALKMAHDLLAKHELDMSDVSEAEREKDDPRGHFMNTGWNAQYAKTIRNAMSKLFRCHYYHGRKINGTRGEHNFVGRESSATTAMYMSDWIITSLLREADRRYGHRLNPAGRSFCVGASSRLWVWVEELIAEKQKEFTSMGVALVLYDVAKKEEEANLAFIVAMGVVLEKKARRSTNVLTNAYESGKTYADSVNLNTQIANQKDQPSLKRG